MNDYDEFMATPTGVLVYEMCRRSFLAGLKRGRSGSSYPRFEVWIKSEFRAQDPQPSLTEEST